ncbi:ADP-ribosyl-[dinitrogen reductase] hydrolase [Parasulfuritortus cantonensis]|uniref:ADP-ribosyl-[dinitrogen reductase] hydrolase n=2 Tax=Parasulfuritortus cantonensis TaxID=2528202 RepID=A0A4R1B0S9_9PROT|nr:ADP-ribosyl-[dinitrogen reductase] hydrolase [Parasulfuritortus cantonensis]
MAAPARPAPARPPSVAERAVAAYLGMAVGDALGATVEFMTPREIAAQYRVHDQIRGGGWLNLRAGQVTDDTTMALALGGAILGHGRVLAQPVAEAFDAWMRAKPVDIGNTVRRGLLHFRKNGAVEVPVSQHDAGNGAAMRVLPVALATLGEPEEVVRLACRTQAHITHNNPLSDAATECLALMVRDALAGADKVRLLHERAHPLARLHPEFTFRAVRQQANPSGYVGDTLVAVFQAFFDTDDFEFCLIDVVNRGGDADTTGAIAGMLAGAVYGPEAIPPRWLDALDPGVRRACAEQAAALVRLT